MSIFTWILLIIISVECIHIGKYLSDSLLHPIRLMSIVWIIFIFFPLLFWKIGYKWNGSGLIWILLAVLCTELGALVVNKKIKSKNVSNNKEMKIDWKIVIFIIILGTICFLLQLKIAGFSLASFTNVDSFLNMNSEVAKERYSGSSQKDIFSQILLCFLYLSALVGGYAFNFSKNKEQKIISTVFSFLPIIGMMLFSNGKSGFISCIILWLAGWCISYLFINGKLPKIKGKYIILGITLLIGIFGILYLVMLIRVGDFSSPMRKIISNKFMVYALGHIVNFDYWFSHIKINDSIEFGINTYMAIFKTLGLVERVQGVYPVILRGFGNVFSAFRGVIADFGIIGGLIYCFLRGIITQYCFEKVSSGNIKSSISSTLLVCSYFWNIYGFIISPWIYTSYILTMIMFWGTLFLIHKRIKFEG